MATALWIIAAGIVLPQVDRWWFSPRRGHPPARTLRDVMRLQRRRINDVTPPLLLAGHWLEFLGWCVLAERGGVWAWAAAAGAGAVKFRHLQEVSHFAVHGVLTRSGRLGSLFAEATVHIPLGFVPVQVRRQRHVREHHPNATVPGADPNLADLYRAGLHPGVGRLRFALALVFPLTATGLVATVRGLFSGLRAGGAGWWRPACFVNVPLMMAWFLGWQATVFAFVVPRLLLYPQLAWLSLLVEHCWFDARPVTGSPVVVEAARCLRLYPHSPVPALIARATWLPYGDLYHFAHSTHPAVRWNYLPALDRALGAPSFSPRALLLGDANSSVIRHHRRSLLGATANFPHLPGPSDDRPSARSAYV